MKHKIQQASPLFMDGKDSIYEITKTLIPIYNMLKRFLNESYSGKRLTNIAISFLTEKTFVHFPDQELVEVYFYGGHLTCEAMIDLNAFLQLEKSKQVEYIWNRSCEILQNAAIHLKNKELYSAVGEAHQKGLDRNINPDFRRLEKEMTFFDQDYLCALWINYRDDKAFSKFAIEKDGAIIFEKEIDWSSPDNGFFLAMYVKMVQEGNHVIIKGAHDVEYFPLKFVITKEMLGLT